MLSQTDAVKQAWAATDRTLDIIVTVDGKDYQATEINSLNYDAGAFTGDTLGIGSTYENSVTIEFSSVVEAFKQGLTVLPKVGILVDGKFEYTSLGTFIISEVNRDRNNNLTTIKALDQMCKLEGQYKPTVSDTASPLDIIADIANQGGVSVNTGELQHLPTLPNIKKIEGQTLRTAIGWVAQLYGGFATFDRDGTLTIRTTGTPDYTISPSEYQQGGLTKNEVAYQTGGIKVTVNTKKTDDSGQEVDDTTTLQAGETTGSQIELTNDSMTYDLLNRIWTGIKDITYYPYTLNWFGNPNLEAGDWVTLTDTQGNKFNVPVNQYTMSFNGGLESTISATQTSSTAGGYAYTGSAGSIKNMIEALQARHTASGNNVYPPSYQGQPKNPKKGDVWYKQNGNNVEVWIYQEDDGKLSWVRTPLDGEVKAELQAMGKKTDEDLTRVKSELSSEAESQWQSMKTATSEADQRLTSLQAEQNASLADLHETADSLHAAANSLHADADSMRASLTGATSELGKDITATRDSLTAVDSSMRTATSETVSELASTRNSLAAVDADLRNGVKQAGNELSAAKTSLAATGNSLATATSELQRKTGQLSGSLSTADSMIMFNSNAITKVSQTADAIRADLTNTKGDVATVKATANSLQSQITDNKNNISSVMQTAQGLTSRVGNAEGNISQLQQTANGLTSTVSNLHAGDRNYARNTFNEWKTLTEFTGATNYCSPSLGIFYLDDLKVGDTVTIGYTIKNNGITAGNFHIQAPGDSLGWNAGCYGPWYDIAKVCPDGATTTLIQYYTLTADNLKNRSFDFVIRTDNFPAGTLSYKGLFVKKGNLATDWSPAPEDVDASISQIKQTADRIQTQVNDNKGNISTVTQTANAVKTDLANTKGDVASVKAKADSLTAQLSDANGNISQLQQTAKGLQSTVAGQDGKISTLQQRADSITSTLSNGGRNLLNGTSSDEVTNTYPASGYTDRLGYVMPIPANKTDYVLSFDAKSTVAGDKILCYLYNPNNVTKAVSSQNVINANADGSMTFNLTTDWVRYWVHYTIMPTAMKPTVLVGRTVHDDGSGTVSLKCVQLEYGETATPWQPSNGDISSLQQTAQGLTADMKDAKGNISNLQVSAGKLTTDMSDAKKNVSSLQETAKELKATVGNEKTGLVSTVKAIPGQISSAITASKQATVITSAVDLHNMRKAGYYLLKGALTNSPVTPWAFLRVITSDSGDRIYHRIWKDNGSTVYTEEWTGSWSGWATHINSDNLKSNVITAINQSTEGVSITGNKITLDGNVNVTPGFTLSADYIKAGTLSADRISGGTLNFSNITVTGLTANSISSGSISGQNLNINLDNGTVEFTKGNLHSTDGGFNISIDTKSFYLDMGNDTKLWIDGNGYHLQESASQHLWMNKDGLHNYTDSNGNGLWINDTTLKILNSSNAGLVAKDGILQFSANPTWNSPNVYSGSLNSQTYGSIGFNSNLLSSSLNGIFIKGREGVVIGTNSYDGGSLFGADSFLDVGQAGSGINLPDDLNKPASMFTKSALTLLGGPTYPASWGMSDKARISIGCDTYYSHSGASMYSVGHNARGNNISINARNTNIIGYDWVNIKCRNGRVALDGQYVHSYPTYNKTTSAGANVYVAEDGALVRSSSARKYKTDIQDTDNDYGNKLIEFTPQKWIDKAEKKRYEEDPENNKKPGYYYGLIADDLDAAGLDMLVNYGAEGEVEGINYDRLAVALLPVIKSLKDQVASLKKQIKALAK